MKKQYPESSLPTVLLLLNIAVSSGVALFPDWTHSNFSTADQVILGFSSFMSLLLIQLLWGVIHLDRYHHRETLLWPIYDSFTQSLNNIRAYMHEVAKDSYGPNDRFLRYYETELRKLETRLRQTAEKKELRVTTDHFPTVVDVLGAFATDEERIYRYTWPILESGYLFKIPAWRHFFELSADMVRERKISQVKVLLVLDNWDLANESNVKALLQFYDHSAHFEAKMITHSDLAVVATDNDIPPHHVDFGLYGEKLLYITEEDTPPETTGRYTKDRHAIRQYRTLFEVIWSSQSLTRPNPYARVGAITLEQLIEIDRAWVAAS